MSLMADVLNVLATAVAVSFEADILNVYEKCSCCSFKLNVLAIAVVVSEFHL